MRLSFPSLVDEINCSFQNWSNSISSTILNCSNWSQSFKSSVHQVCSSSLKTMRIHFFSFLLRNQLLSTVQQLDEISRLEPAVNRPFLEGLPLFNLKAITVHRHPQIRWGNQTTRGTNLSSTIEVSVGSIDDLLPAGNWTSLELRNKQRNLMTF